MEYPQIPGVIIDGELGRGAHSVVYSGRQGGVRCAVKLPRTKARWTRWIYREAVSLARVKHTRLPGVFEVGDVDGLPYLIMELVEGETLAGRLAAGPIDQDTVLTIGRQLADVLAAVHQAGLVHRDVKPRNIVVEHGVTSLKLVDFGFATPMERVGTVDAAGTAAYAAPEQLAPPGTVDARADLYAVGRVLFECLYGAPGAVRAEGPWGEAAAAALVARGVRPGLAEVVGGLLRTNPDERYSSADALGADLELLFEGLPILGPAGYRRARFRYAKLVGRRGELERVLGACRSAIGAVAVVRGARGSGKTAFLKALDGQLRVSGRAVLVACRQDDSPLSTLRRILEAYCDEHLPGQGGSTEKIREAMGNLAPVAHLIAPSRMQSVLGAAAPASSPSVDDPFLPADSLAEGAAQLLLALATKVGPWALLVDDAQWMDPASAGALARVAHRIGEAPLALVLGARSEPVGALERFAELRGERSIRLELSRLTAEEVAELVASHLGEVRASPELVARINAMAGGTPLGVLEVLGAFLDAGALRPHARTWIFDPGRMEGVRLPRGAIALLGRRLVELPTATLRVLEAAAILGTSFDDNVVARMLSLKSEDLAYALAGARRAGVIVGGEHAENRFVHDSVREILVEDLADAERRRLHDCAAQAIEALPDPSFEELCATAVHYAAGEPGRDPASAYRVARAAGEAAVARFDSATALRFLAQARSAANAARVELDVAFFQSVGEAELRLGNLDESLGAFEEALRRADDSLTRARILGRLSWVHQAKADADRAWEMLASAFAALGRRMPNESVGSVAQTSARVVRWGLGRLLDRPATRHQAEVDLLAQLHYQNVRLGIEYGMPARVLQSSLASLTVSDVASSEATRARARVIYGLVLTVLGRRDAGAREMAEAKARATRHGDPVTIAFCVQLKGIASCLTGDLDEALILLRECVDVYGPWLELNEYCQLASTADLIHSFRGRANEAWPWMERAIERLRRTGTRSVAAELFVFHRARAALAAVGRDMADDAWLAREFAAMPRGGGQGFHRMASWGPRARYYLEAGDVGEEFDALVREFALDGHGPRGAHPALVEYFIAVAHGRIHQALRATPSERSRRLAELRTAVTELRVAAKIPLHRAHALVADAFLAWFEHRASVAHKRLAQAEALADQQSAPWVLYAVARCRAHMLREAGRMEAARDQARVAELFAREHGAVTRSRWIREEFALETSGAASTKLVVSRGSSSSRANRQLATLLQIARAPRLDLRSEQQAAAILDELIESLEAERGAIWFQPDPAVDGITATRHRATSASGQLTPDSARSQLLRDVRLSGQPWPPSEPGAPRASGDYPFDSSRVAAVPLFLYEKPVGALCIERGAEHGPFELADRNLLALLAHQVPIALEVARLLAEREQLHASLQHAKKMEAMGAMAGGLAHDFNNMLAAMKVALGAAQERAALDSELTVELDIIAEATTRASQLTSQLLSFSRHQPLSVSVHDVNQLISTLEPMLRRVVGSGIETQVKLSPAVDAVEVDQGSFDQALVNLLINARDAMPRGGTLTISTRNVVLGPAAAQRASLQPGEYVEVEVTDTGEGMSTEVMTRIFEPFFTTKPAGAGSGLGLAMVYAFARNCGGSIEVSSEIGRGTQFRLYFKRVERKRASRPTRSSTAPVEPAVAALREDGPDTILVVDDDDLVRRSIAKILERHGYRVVAASGSNEALDVVQEQGGRIALVILDVLMPGITGPELGRRLFDLKLPAKLLFVSGFSPESIPIDDAQVAAEMLLQKPFSQTALLERVRQLMYS